MSTIFSPVALNIVEDFFNWIYETLSSLFQFIENAVVSLTSLFSFLSLFGSFFIESFAFLPVVALTILSSTIVIMIVKLVLGR